MRPPLPVIDGAGQGVELLDLEQPSSHLGPQLRLGHVLQHEFGLQRAAELAVGIVAAPPQGDLASVGFEKAGIANQTGRETSGSETGMVLSGQTSVLIDVS